MKEFQNHKGQHIGTLKDGVFRKKIQGQRHILRLFGGAIGIEKAVVDEIQGNCTEIRIKDTSSETIYSTDYQTFRAHGIQKNFETPQVFLPIKYFNVEQAKQLQLLGS